MMYASRLAGEPVGSPGEHLPPALVFGSSAAARDRGIAQIEAAGLRLAAAVPIEDAVERIDHQPAASAVWIELDRDHGDALDRLLSRIDRDADAGVYGAVICAGAALIDPISARLTSPRVTLLVDGDCNDRVVALALACAIPPPAKVGDIATDNSTARLRQLSEDVGRIAATLARLSNGPDSVKGLAVAPAGSTEKPAGQVTREQVQSVIRARRARARFFSEELFADPAWDMLLDLTQSEIAQVRVPVSSLCIAAAVPATTALRWIKTLTDTGIFLRRADPHDGRRVFVELSAATSLAMRNYFGHVGAVAGS